MTKKLLSWQEIAALNQAERDAWVKQCLSIFVKSDDTVLDVGCGTSPYRSILNHTNYIAHDFGGYIGQKLGGTTEYAEIDIRSDITYIPLASDSVDVIICTEVLEHVPEPINAMKEISRLLKSDGIAIITTPFTSGRHQLPFHYYSGFSPEWFQYAAALAHLNVVSLSAHGGFCRLMAQEIGRVIPVITKHNYFAEEPHTDALEYLKLANKLLEIDRLEKNEDFSIGFHVILQKRGNN
jgi:SAM-dependent methyltransferase